MDPEIINTGTPQLLCALRDGVATVTLNRPEARNALSDELTPALRRMLQRCTEDPSIGALLITGMGRAFCAGGDIKEMGASASGARRTPQERVERLRIGQRTLTGVLVNLPIPTVAALPGPAAGAGLSIALACDLRIMAESAFVTTAYARIGFSGDYGVNWLLTRAVGSARARELMFLCERVSAARCHQLGLTNLVVPDTELQGRAFELAKQMAQGPRTALRLIKANLNDAIELDLLSALDREAERMIEAGASPDHQAAVKAFVERTGNRPAPANIGDRQST
jgi:enoyl-CoA hydratase/carnithine racemase